MTNILTSLFGQRRAEGFIGITKTIGSFFFYHKSYLHVTGWLKSFLNQKPLNQNEQPIPWVTFSFIEFIKERLSKNMSMLEYGSGNSTLFYAKLCKEVTAIEHDKEWIDILNKDLPKNAEIIHISLQNEKKSYCEAASTLQKQYDIIIIDGRHRNNCIQASFSYLKPEGVLILDDTEREKYQEGILFMENKGFKKIDFWGLAPGMFYNKCTTVFYRPNNCLNI